MNVRLTLVVMHSNIWRQSSPLFLTLGLGIIHDVHFASLFQASGQKQQKSCRPDRMILLDLHTVCEFCDQYCQDATRGLPGHWNFERIFISSDSSFGSTLKSLDFRLCLVEHAPRHSHSAVRYAHSQQHTTSPFPPSISGSAHGKYSRSFTPEALLALAAMY